MIEGAGDMPEAELVRLTARLLGMSESEARIVIAFERGEAMGDVIEGPAQTGPEYDPAVMRRVAEYLKLKIRTKRQPD